MKYKIYFIGAGPGGLEHLTLLGKQCIKECGLIFAPNIYRETFSPLLKGKKILDPFNLYFDEVVKIVDENREKYPVAFLLPGDGAVFSPFQSFIDYFADEAVTVPGVGIVNAASAALKRTFDLPDVANTIVLTSTRSLKAAFEEHDFLSFARKDVTLVIYMNHIPLPELIKRLIPKMGKDCPIAILHKLSLPEEEIIIGTLENITGKVKKDYFQDRKEPSMAMIIVGHVLKKKAKKSSWNFRKKNIWEKRER
jgi:precorrin-4/cobalt-precorrin-4 C11-methyltransferase